MEALPRRSTAARPERRAPPAAAPRCTPDARHGWLVGDYGNIASTRDGGQSWQRRTSGTAERLLDVFALDVGTAWVIGDRGLIFATPSGGD